MHLRLTARSFAAQDLARCRASLLALLAAGVLGFSSSASALPSYDEVKQDFRSSETQILSREGEVIQRIRTDATVRRGQWTALSDVSPALRTALVLSEDKRFFEHSGVDWSAVSAAAWGNLWNQRTRGASTITMQLAGLLDGDWRQGAGGRTVVQKVGQAVAAQVLDRRWRKDQILEAYLNLVPFRGELVGIDALSRTLFDKAPHGLDEREAAVAAALVRAPNAKPAQVAQRACGVLKEMRKNQASQATSCDALDLFTTGALQRRAFDPSEGIAPHFSRQLLAQLKSQRVDVKSAQVRSSISAPLQRTAIETLTRHLRELRGRNVEDGAIVVLDNATGEVLAWVGSSGLLSQASEVDGVLAWRQPGSTLKPFLYAEAIAEKRLTAASLIEDSPAYIPTANGLYIPQNYDRHFKGWVSARTALAASLNVPAVRTLVMVGTDRFHEQLRAFGMPLRESGGYYGYSLALGSAEVPLLYLTNGYRTLGNGGRWSAVAMQSAPKSKGAPQSTSKQVIDEGAAFIVGDMLSDPNARVRTFGTDSVLNTRFWTASKTGTSKDMRDNWALGWSQRYTVGVWVGNASGAPMHDVSGTSGAAPIWAELMNWLHRNQRNSLPKPPTNVVKTAVQFGALDTAGNWLESPRDEWFLRGTEQKRFAIDAVESTQQAQNASTGQRGKHAKASSPPKTSEGMPARILSPVSGTIVALDPDIPPARQRVQFIATDAPDGVRWLFNGKEQGRGARWGWLPWPGRYKVELVDTAGKVLDETAIEVRGAGVRQQK